jgi:hypothetical protein
VNQINETGWGFLTINTRPGIPDVRAMHAAGFLEGCLTHDLMWDMWNTTNANYPVSDAVVAFLTTNDAWVRSQIAAFPSDPYWIHVNLVLEQTAGMLAGHNSVAPTPQQFTAMQMLILAAGGDLGDISRAVTPSLRKDWLSFTANEIEQRHLSQDHCSALVKVTDDGFELLSAHVTWGSPQEMLRLYKNYRFPVRCSFPILNVRVFSLIEC